jgi:hypothetical protein
MSFGALKGRILSLLDVVIAAASHPTEGMIATGALGGDKMIKIWMLKA